MPRPSTKEELLFQAGTQYEKLFELINSMTVDEREIEFAFDENAGKEAHWKRDKNIRDVLCHLYEWHRLLLCWLNDNTRGVNSPFLPLPYNWKTYVDMNIVFWEKHRDTSYNDAVKLLDESHKAVISQIMNFSNDELFTKKYFSWTGTTNLASYCISVTSSHYDWAIKKLKKHLKNIR